MKEKKNLLTPLCRTLPKYNNEWEATKSENQVCFVQKFDILSVCVHLDQVFGSEITFLLSMIFIGYKLVCAKLLRRKFTYQ